MQFRRRVLFWRFVSGYVWSLKLHRYDYLTSLLRAKMDGLLEAGLLPMCCLKHVFRVTDVALSFFRSYLEDREQVISVLGYGSVSSSLFYGVPQGSVLGPILFLLCTQPLSGIVNSVLHHMLADDTELYRSDVPTHFASLVTDIQSCMNDVKEWTFHNKLQLNEDKTEALLLTSSKFSDLLSSLKVGQNDIHFSDSA